MNRSLIRQIVSSMGFARLVRSSSGNAIGIAGEYGSVIPLNRPIGLAGGQRHFSAGAFPAGTTNVTIQNQIPPPAAATGFRAVFTNGTTTASTVTTAKAAIATADGHTGANLNYVSLSFDANASAALPAITGAAPHDVRTLVVSDHVSLPIAASEFLIMRTYFSGSGCAEQPSAGDLAAFRTATGLKYKTAYQIGILADNAAPTTSAVSEGQLIAPASIIWTFDRKTYTLACVGGSTLRGQGSSGNATGLVYRTASALSNSSRIVTPYVAAISGQGSIASMHNAKQVIEKIRPEFLFFLPGSGNDADMTAAGFEAMKGRAATVIDLCRRNNVIPIIGTMAPANLPADVELLRLALNEWVRNTLANNSLVSDIARCVEDPLNPAQLLPAYNSGDGIHWNDDGHSSATAELTAAVRAIIG